MCQTAPNLLSHSSKTFKEGCGFKLPQNNDYLNTSEEEVFNGNPCPENTSRVIMTILS